MRIVIALMALLTLSACETQQEEEYRVRSTLPNGCEITDLGTYHGVEHVLVVRCNGKISSVVNETTTILIDKQIIIYKRAIVQIG